MINLTVTGSQGAQGANGSQGAQGAQGTQGANGAAGSNGAQGHQGYIGTSGSVGTQGFQGSTGNPGGDSAPVTYETISNANEYSSLPASASVGQTVYSNSGIYVCSSASPLVWKKYAISPSTITL